MAKKIKTRGILEKTRTQQQTFVSCKNNRNYNMLRVCLWHTCLM